MKVSFVIFFFLSVDLVVVECAPECCWQCVSLSIYRRRNRGRIVAFIQLLPRVRVPNFHYLDTRIYNTNTNASKSNHFSLEIHLSSTESRIRTFLCVEFFAECGKICFDCCGIRHMISGPSLISISKDIVCLSRHLYVVVVDVVTFFFQLQVLSTKMVFRLCSYSG